MTARPRAHRSARNPGAWIPPGSAIFVGHGGRLAHGPWLPLPTEHDGDVEVQVVVGLTANFADAESVGDGPGPVEPLGAGDDERRVVVEAIGIAEVHDVETAIAQFVGGGAGHVRHPPAIEHLDPDPTVDRRAGRCRAGGSRGRHRARSSLPPLRQRRAGEGPDCEQENEQEHSLQASLHQAAPTWAFQKRTV